MSILNPEFVDLLATVTASLTSEAEATRASGGNVVVTMGQCVAAAAAEEGVSLDPKAPETALVFKLAQAEGHLSEYQVIRGQFGGVRRIGEPEKAPKGPAPTPKAIARAMTVLRRAGAPVLRRAGAPVPSV